MRFVRKASVFALAGAVLGSASCGGLGSDDVQVRTVPDIPMQHEIGPLEGEVDLVAWTGYAESGKNDPSVDWVHPFQRKTGCDVRVKVADSSDSMVSLMRTGEYDGVSASGDASLRLIYAGLVAPVNTGLVPNYADIAPYLKNQPFNSVGGQMYGIPHGYGANVLMYRTDKISRTPRSWKMVWDGDSPAAGGITDYDSPIYIADAAVYLRAHRPALHITNPYELTEEQFDAAVALLRRQRPSVNQYWTSYLDELHSFQVGDNLAGTAWQVTANVLLSKGVPVATTIPAEGATGWSDTWMISSTAEHPDCMYKWMNWIASPHVQAEVAQWFGEAPANLKACHFAGKEFCEQYHAGDLSFYKKLDFWRTPVRDCGDSRGNVCVPYSRWAQAWTQIKG